MNAEKVTDYIVKWLNDYADKAAVKGFVIGVSGGVDSAVTSALCARTGRPTLCLEMPIHQAENQVSRAWNHMEKLTGNFSTVRTTRINLTTVFDELVKVFPEQVTPESRLLALANTRARLRMTTLYYYATLYGYLVVGTGNKVEDFGVGFYTKYGDGGVDISPIADLLKTEVYQLASFLEINKDIITAPPTDGLWGDNRTDEDQIGASYPELEWAMKMNKAGKSSSDFVGREREVFDIYMTYHQANAHKMIPIPVCEIPGALR